MSKYLLTLGTQNFKDPDNGGIHTCYFDDGDFSFEKIGYYDNTVMAGQQYYDAKRSILYIADEVDGHFNRKAGGGRVYAYKLDKMTGQLELINWISALMSKTCYIWPSASGNYLMVANHTGSTAATKVVRNSDGSIGNVMVYEDGGIVLIRLNPDGSLDKVTDYVVYPEKLINGKIAHTHCHSVMADPSGKIFYSCDKGLDMIYSYAIDEENGLIIRKAEKTMDYKTAPRYLCFHPYKKIMYQNNETSNYLFAFEYDTETGLLREICRKTLVDEPYEKMMPSDLTITHNGRYLYAATRNTARIVVFRVDDATGEISKIQTVDTGDDNIRGLGISPDDRYLFTASPGTGKLACYVIKDDGQIEKASELAVRNVGNVGIIALD